MRGFAIIAHVFAPHIWKLGTHKENIKLIDYSEYSLDELLEVQKTIDPESENFPAFEREIKNRKSEVEQAQSSSEQSQYDLDVLKIKAVGCFQLGSAVVLSLILLYNAFFGSGVSLFLALIAAPLVILNGVAGYTAFNGLSKWYWLSVSNQALQLISASLGSFYINYAGLGYINVVVNWGQEFSLGFDAQFSPSFAFYKYTETLQNQFIGVDILAILFIFAFVRVKDFEARA